MNEQLLKFHAKDAAQDLLLMDLMLLVYARLGLSNDEVKTRFANIRKLAGEMSIPGIGPEYSDHMAAETREALEAVLLGVAAARGIPPA